ncbi:Non-specific serine/threonine protein kinase [Bertholletia excelsa]
MHQEPSFCVIFFITFLTTINLVFSQTPNSSCVLEIPLAPFGNGSNCIDGNWDGFLKGNCCQPAFDSYLYGLGKRANQTGEIFLNSTQQIGCLPLLRSTEGDVMKCGIEKLSSGGGGCSDYTVTDVVNKLGKKLRTLHENCELLGIDDRSNKACAACKRSWEEMGETEICRFAVLVQLTSSKIGEKKRIKALYTCLGEQSLPIDDQGGKITKKAPSHEGLWIMMGVIGAFIVIVMVTSWILFRKLTKRPVLKGKAASNYSPPKEPSCRKVPIKAICSATDNFSALNFIGQGIAGKVYKGVLPNGQHIAVKQILNDGHMETFVREVRSLSHVRHPNLVTLLGYYEEEEECFLIYELCHNGNLSEWLFDKDKVLSWSQRIEIAIDCARGLRFLHSYPEGCIVHRDIKPTNILLCANFQAKLSDFGLSKVMNLGESFVSSEVRGTFGYVDPEYQKNHHVNSSGDVYSFGIVLLQLLSGQRVINLDSDKAMLIGKMAKFLTRGGNMTEFADPKLDGEFPEEAFELILKLALSCTGIKQQRPSMEQVVVKLEKALDISARMKSIIVDPSFEIY